ncbi:SAM-dependent methyltransferase [Nonomuraea sp. NPDC046570]|uniref:SAM-dependent methyltransferase n=1 Tax=Nonomuraea sp. NPDC046570 TaxID=3155255 RepID=UPI0033FA8930
MSDTERAPAGIDPTIPSVARIYDYYLGGKDNFAADRAAADKIIKLVPNSREVARDNRDFLGRAVRYLAGSGIRQFLDIGTGLPTQENVHEVALAAAPDSRVVYVDNDPIVLTHARALLADNASTIVVNGDMHEPDAIIEAAAGHLDFAEPVAVLLVAVLHFLPDDEETYRIVEGIRARLAPGSALVVSHVYAGDHTAETIKEGAAVYARTATGSLTGRGPEQVARYFEGLRILEPGIVPVEAWRPDYDEVKVDLVKPGILCAIGEVG